MGENLGARSLAFASLFGVLNVQPFGTNDKKKKQSVSKCGPQACASQQISINRNESGPKQWIAMQPKQMMMHVYG